MADSDKSGPPSRMNRAGFHSQDVHVLMLLALVLSGTIAGTYANSRLAAVDQVAGLSRHAQVSPPDSTAPTGFSGYVKDTLILSNGTLVRGNFAPSNGYRIVVPVAVAYDSVDNRVYVTDGRSSETTRSADSVAVVDGTTNKLVTSIAVVDPRGITFDPSNDYVYVASKPGVTILNGATGAVLGNVTLGGGTSGLTSNPTEGTSGLAYDPADNNLYVAGYTTSSVAIIDASTNHLVANVTVGAHPTGIVYDSFNKEMYVNCLESGIISTIGGPNYQVTNITAISPPPSPPSAVFTRAVQPPYENVAFDTSNNNVYLVDYYALGYDEKIFVISSGSNSVANFTVTRGLGSLAYDSWNNQIYVTSGLSYNGPTGYTVTAIDPASYKQLANVTVGFGPAGVTYNPQDHDLYVANSHSYSISIIDDRTDRVVATDFLQTYPSAVAYDSNNGMLYVANEGSFDAVVFKDSLTENIFMVNPTDGSVTPIFTGQIAPTNLIYDPHNNYLYISSLLPSIVVMDTSTSRVVANITIPPVGFGIAGLAYDPQNHRIYVANNGDRSSGSAIYVIDDTSNTVVATIHEGVGPLGLAYDPSNNDIYATQNSIISAYSTNKVTVISGSTNSVVANITVGSMPADIAYDAANRDVYVADLGSSDVSVIGDRDNTVVATIPIKMNLPFVRPWGLIDDPFNNEIFVTNQFPDAGQQSLSNIVSVIDGDSNSFVGNFTLGYNPGDGAYDLNNGYLYVTNYLSGTLSVLTSRSPSPSVPSPHLLGLDPTLFYEIVAAMFAIVLVVTVAAYRSSRTKPKEVQSSEKTPPGPHLNVEKDGNVS